MVVEEEEKDPDDALQLTQESGIDALTQHALEDDRQGDGISGSMKDASEELKALFLQGDPLSGYHVCCLGA